MHPRRKHVLAQVLKPLPAPNEGTQIEFQDSAFNLAWPLQALTEGFTNGRYILSPSLSLCAFQADEIK